MSYKVGRGGMLDGLDEALAGMAAGDEKTFESQLVGGDLVGEDVEVTGQGHQVQEQELPELDDEFAQLASEFDTVDELATTSASASAAASASSRPPPPATPSSRSCSSRSRSRCPSHRHRRAQRPSQNIEQQLAYAGITMEKYLEDEGQTQEEFEADLERRVRDAVAAQFILDEVAKKEELGVDQAELSEHLCGARSSPARTRRSSQPHVRAQPHPRAGPGDPARQGARPDRRVRDRQGRLRQRGRAEEPAPRRHHR
jgi:trigger factor